MENNTEQYDLIVIGAGSGGVRAARLAAASGKSVAIIEGRFFGGTCVNVGCVPKKLLVQASSMHQQLASAKGFCWQNIPDKTEVNWSGLRDKVQTETQRLEGIYRQLLQNHNVEIIEGYARFLSDTVVVVNDKKYSSSKILVATGSKAVIPDNVDPQAVSISDDLFTLDKLPGKCLVIGAGYIAVEFAGILNNLGCKVDLACRGNKPLRYLDNSLGDYLYHGLQTSGIHLITNTEVDKVSRNNESTTVKFKNQQSQISYDKVFVAIGRKPDIDNLGLENTGVEIKEGAIKVDDRFKSSSESVFAVGDVIGQAQLTPVALRQAMLFIKHHIDSGLAVELCNFIPSAVFSQPEIAFVGKSEQEAIESYSNIDIYLTEFNPLANKLSGSPYKSLLKLLVDSDTDKIIGVHMGGEHSAEVIQAMAIVMEAGGRKKDVDRTLGIHPSISEEFVTLRQAWKRYRNGEAIKP